MDNPELTPEAVEALRDGILPRLPTLGLEAVRDALLHDGAELIQNATTVPAAIIAWRDQPPQSACLVGLALWRGEKLATVGDIDRRFGEVCTAADLALCRGTGEVVKVHHALNAFDSLPRADARRLFLPPVCAELAYRATQGEVA